MKLRTKNDVVKRIKHVYKPFTLSTDKRCVSNSYEQLKFNRAFERKDRISTTCIA